MTHTQAKTGQSSAKTPSRAEILSPAIEAVAAGFFVLGSIFFFGEATDTYGNWMFLIGSAMFGINPTIRMIQAIRMYRRSLNSRTEYKGQQRQCHKG